MIKVINGGLLVKRSYTTELIYTANAAAGDFNQFADVQQLRNVKVYGIEIFSQDQLTKGKSGKTVLTLAQLATLVMTFYDKSEAMIYQQPATAFIASVNGGLYRLFDGLRLNLTKSGATAVDAGVLANQTLICTFYYIDNVKDAKKPATAKK